MTAKSGNGDPSKPVGELNARSMTVVFAAFVGSMLNGMIFASVAISVFLGRIAVENRWNFAQVGGAASFLFAGMALGSLLLGRLIDAKGARRVQLPLTLVSGLLIGSIPFAGRSIPLFYGVHLLLGIANPGALSYNKLLSTWFSRHRGVALTAVGVGVFISQSISPPLIGALQSAVGWRGTYGLLALAELSIAFPVLLAWFRERLDGDTIGLGEASRDVRDDGTPAISVRSAMGGRTFWFLIGAQAAGLFAFMGVSAHAVGIMSQRGVASATAVWGLSLFAFGGLLAQPLTGLLLDNLNTPRLLVPFAVASGASLTMLGVVHGEYSTLAALLLFGLACGGQTSMTAYMATRYFGVRSYSSVYGTLFPVLLLFSAPGPAFVGAVFDATRSYDVALMALAAAQIAGVAVSFCLRPYSYPTKEGDDGVEPARSSAVKR